MSVQYILKCVNRIGYYNGSVEGDMWAFNDVDLQSDIDDRYMFNSLEEIKALPSYAMLRGWYDIVELGGLLKPKAPHELYKPPLPKLLKGKYGEVCIHCGINILAKEPYILWVGTERYCIHCIMKGFSDIDEMLEMIPNDLKKEWAVNGKLKGKECLEHISNNEGG